MLRIIPDLCTEPRRLKLSGVIAAEDLGLLAEALNQHYAETRPLVLDLAEVKFIDASGLQLLRHWLERGIQLQGGSWFIQVLLRGQGLI